MDAAGAIPWASHLLYSEAAMKSSGARAALMWSANSFR